MKSLDVLQQIYHNHLEHPLPDFPHPFPKRRVCDQLKRGVGTKDQLLYDDASRFMIHARETKRGRRDQGNSSIEAIVLLDFPMTNSFGARHIISISISMAGWERMGPSLLACNSSGFGSERQQIQFSLRATT